MSLRVSRADVRAETSTTAEVFCDIPDGSRTERNRLVERTAEKTNHAGKGITELEKDLKKKILEYKRQEAAKMPSGDSQQRRAA